MITANWSLFVVQGITEFLPVSSTAHILLFSKWLNLGELNPSQLSILHIVPGLVLIGYFRHEIMNLLLAAWHFCLHPFHTFRRANSNMRFLGAVVLATFPVLICGLIVELAHINLYAFKTSSIIGINSIVFGTLLGYSDYRSNVRGSTSEWTVRRSVQFGFMHILALIPGVSRLGICLTAARLLGFGREASIRFAFITGIPALLCAGSLGILKSFSSNSVSVPLQTYLLSGMTFLIGWVALSCFMHLSKKWGLLPFALYRVGLGILLLCLN